MPIYIQKNDQQIGPLEDAEILAALQAGTYSPEDLAWREGMPEWHPLRTFFPSAAGLPPPLPRGPVIQAAPRLEDSATVRMMLPVGRSGWAIAAGYLGLFALVVLPAPLALVVSIVAIWDVRRSRESAKPRRGMGRAIFGLVTGLLGTAFLIFLLVVRKS